MHHRFCHGASFNVLIYSNYNLTRLHKLLLYVKVYYKVTLYICTYYMYLLF